jgi:predicted AAA+ superfamily ATPase
MYSRKLTALMREMLGQFRILYLTGPRQAGKTTLAKELAHELGMTYLTLGQQAVLESAIHDPHGLIQSFEGTKFRYGVLFYTGQDVLPFTQGSYSFHALPIGLLCR